MINKIGFSGSIAGKVEVQGKINQVSIKRFEEGHEQKAILSHPGDILLSPDGDCVVVNKVNNPAQINSTMRVEPFNGSNKPTTLNNNELSEYKRIGTLNVSA